MTEDIVERVAAAIEGVGELDFDAMALAAIAAMREPTEAMIDAADDICPIARGTETHKMSGGKVPEDYWRAMIDAALAADPDPTPTPSSEPV